MHYELDKIDKMKGRKTFYNMKKKIKFKMKRLLLIMLKNSQLSLWLTSKSKKLEFEIKKKWQLNIEKGINKSPQL